MHSGSFIVKDKSWPEKLPYPSSPIFKWAFKSPILFYRLGLGFLVGRLFMVITTTGRRSRLPRRTAIEFHEHKGRKYVYSAWGEKSDWYRNIQADPHITIQTWRGTESVLARHITQEAELAQVFEFAISNPMMRTVMKSTGIEMTLDGFLAHKERFTFVTFDHINHPTPEPVKADFAWIWILALLACFIAIYVTING
jgi:deazaflavin-dependent oxidoreductase (nitroreductase family)